MRECARGFWGVAKIFGGLGKCLLPLQNSFCILENTFLRLENYFCGLEKYLLRLEKSLQTLENTFRTAKKPRRTLLLSPQSANINQSAMQIAKRYLEFDAEAKEFMHHLSGAYSRLAVSQRQYERMSGELADWTAALALYIDPTTHTPAGAKHRAGQCVARHSSFSKRIHHFRPDRKRSASPRPAARRTTHRSRDCANGRRQNAESR